MAERSRKLTISELAVESGSLIQCSVNLPLDLSASEFVWFVEHGTVDIFIEEHQGDTVHAAPQHLLRAEAGRLIPSFAPATEITTLSTVAKGLPGTRLRQIPTASLYAIESDELAKQIDAWVLDISTKLSRYDTDVTRADLHVKPGESRATEAGVISTRRNIVWLSGLSANSSLYLGLMDPSEVQSDDELILPLAQNTWIRLFSSQKLTVQSSNSLAQDDNLLSAVAQFHKLALAFERLNRSLAVVDQVNLERERIFNRQTEEENARQQLFSLFEPTRESETVDTDDALTKALNAIGEHEQVSFKIPAPADETSFSERLVGILDASGVRARRVKLRDKDRWWKTASGAMLGFREDDGRPVALLPGKLGQYREIDPKNLRNTRINARHAKLLDSEAWLFYCPLTTESANLSDLVKFATRGLSVQFARFLVTGFVSALITLLPALILGFVVDEVIPKGEINSLFVAGVALSVIAVLGALFHVLQGMSLARLENQASTRAEAAVWDRLIRLPSHFLQQFSTGGLAQRTISFQSLRDVVHNSLANGILSIIFLLPALVIVFLYDSLLGAIVVAFGLLSLCITLFFGLRQITPSSLVQEALQKLTGQLFQLVNGISVLRLVGAEGSAFAVWAQSYRAQKKAEMKIHSINEHVQALITSVPFLVGASLLAVGTWLGRDSFSMGDFLVAYTVFLVYQDKVVKLGASLTGIASMLASIHQLSPLLAEPPEIITASESVDSLTGDIKIDHVSFRYSPDSPLILDDVSIRTRPREFIAITGESGAGKSTIFKLLLGLIHPTNGAIYYDRRDLRNLNIKQVRRKIGSISQDIELHPDDIWDNIVRGQDNVSGNEVWAAARLAIIDQGIRAMPMQMRTFVGTGVSSTSGGESQRIVIARALLNNPRILLLDEATNWLDNESQAKVMNNLVNLNTTRIVIAHRLSTLRQADRIYVLQNGGVAEVGSYDELMEENGIFRELVQRQLT